MCGVYTHTRPTQSFQSSHWLVRSEDSGLRDCNTGHEIDPQTVLTAVQAAQLASLPLPLLVSSPQSRGNPATHLKPNARPFTPPPNLNPSTSFLQRLPETPCGEQARAEPRGPVVVPLHVRAWEASPCPWTENCLVSRQNHTVAGQDSVPVTQNPRWSPAVSKVFPGPSSQVRAS